ncbi:MAG: alpha/beta fold hydrolase [Bacillota bacterium]
MRPNDFDYKSNYAKIGRYNLHYLDEGSGETILLLHGNPTWCYLYRNIIRQLRANYRCIAPDFLGFGLSDKPAEADYSLAKQAEMLNLLIKALGLKDITLVGHDIGGIIGLKWAAGNKKMVKRLVILNTRGSVPAVFGEPAYRPPWPYILMWPLRVPGIGELLVQGMNFLIKLVMPLSFGNKNSLKETGRGFLFPYQCWKDRKAQLDTVRQIPILKSDPLYQMLLETGKNLSGWQVPVQIIWGLKDPAFNPSIIDEFKRLFPNHSHTLRIPHAGHFVAEEEPEAVAGRIDQFIRRYPGGGQYEPH